MEASLRRLNDAWPPAALPLVRVVEQFPLGEAALLHLFAASSICAARLVREPTILLWLAQPQICSSHRGYAEMTEALLETIRRNDLREGYIRQIVTRGVGNLGLNPTQCKRPSVIIIATTIALYPKEVCERGLKVALEGRRS